MKCPNDNAQLLLSERQGVEIDYCPQCRGVWLDRGELDKLIEKVSVQPSSSAPIRNSPSNLAPAQTFERDRDRDRDDDDDDYRRRGTTKRKSMLGELFDF